MSTEFSIDESEKIFADFQNVTSGPLADLAAVLRDLADVPTLPQSDLPPLLPSKISVTTIPITHVRRAGITTTIAIGLLTVAIVGAAAFVGVPEPVANFAKVSIEVVQKAISKIAKVVTGNPTADNSAPSITSVDNKTAEISPDGSPNPTDSVLPPLLEPLHLPSEHQDEDSESSSPEPSETAEAKSSETAEPSSSPEPSETSESKATESPEPSSSPGSNETSENKTSESPEPSSSPEPSETSESKATESPEPSPSSSGD